MICNLSSAPRVCVARPVWCNAAGGSAAVHSGKGAGRGPLRYLGARDSLSVSHGRQGGRLHARRLDLLSSPSLDLLSSPSLVLVPLALLPLSLWSVKPAGDLRRLPCSSLGFSPSTLPQRGGWWKGSTATALCGSSSNPWLPWCARTHLIRRWTLPTHGSPGVLWLLHPPGSPWRATAHLLRPPAPPWLLPMQMQEVSPRGAPPPAAGVPPQPRRFCAPAPLVPWRQPPPGTRSPRQQPPRLLPPGHGEHPHPTPPSPPRCRGG